MTDYEAYKLEGMEDMIKALKEMPQVALPILEDAVTKSVKLLQAWMAQYPPSTEANRPGRVDSNGRPMGYYERGRGWWYPVLQKQTVEIAGRFAAIRAEETGELYGKSRGVIKASRAMRKAGVSGYKLRQTSQMLGKSWTSEVYVLPASVEGVVGTDTSYAPHVQGDTQASLAAQRGWRTLEQGLQENAGAISTIFNQANAQIAQRWNGA